MGGRGGEWGSGLGGGGNLQGTQSHKSEQNRGQPLGQTWDLAVLTSRHTKQYMQWWRVTMRRTWLLRCAALLLGAARVAVDMVAMMPPRVCARQAACGTLLCAAGSKHAAQRVRCHVGCCLSLEGGGGARAVVR